MSELNPRQREAAVAGIAGIEVVAGVNASDGIDQGVIACRVGHADQVGLEDDHLPTGWVALIRHRV